MSADPPGSRPFAGFERPTYTQVPDQLFDELMARLSGAELKVLLYIVRRTIGFKRESDAISIQQIAEGITTSDNRVLDHGTGLSKRAVVTALHRLVEMGAIVREEHRGPKRDRRPSIHRLRWQGDPPPFTTGVMQKVHKGSEEIAVPLCKDFTTVMQKGNPQQTVVDKQVKDTPTPTARPPAAPAYSDEFERWWRRYPRKEAKAAAGGAWRRLGGGGDPPADLIALLHAGIDRWLASRQWGDGIYPHPDSWLNGRRWEDEPAPARPPATNGGADLIRAQGPGSVHAPAPPTPPPTAEEAARAAEMRARMRTGMAAVARQLTTARPRPPP